MAVTPSERDRSAIAGSARRRPRAATAARRRCSRSARSARAPRPASGAVVTSATAREVPTVRYVFCATCTAEEKYTLAAGALRSPRRRARTHTASAPRRRRAARSRARPDTAPARLPRAGAHPRGVSSPAQMRCITCVQSPSNSAMMFMHSGSPKRALNSITETPAGGREEAAVHHAGESAALRRPAGRSRAARSSTPARSARRS